MSEVIFSMNAEVREDGTLELWQHNRHPVGFARTKVAMEQVRDELTRMLEEGSTNCPFRHT